MSSSTCRSIPHHLTRCSDKALPQPPMGRGKAPPALLKPSSSKRWRTSSLRAAYKHLSPSNVCSQASANSDAFNCDQDDVYIYEHVMQHRGKKFTTTSYSHLTSVPVQSKYCAKCTNANTFSSHFAPTDRRYLTRSLLPACAA